MGKGCFSCFSKCSFLPASWKTLCCDDSDEEEDEKEVLVYMNDQAANAPFEYPNNFVKTSKFTWYNFLPLGLLWQFSKVSNFYFLLNMIFTLIPGIAPISPATAIIPLAFVLGVALIKEGVEDYRRHKEDNKSNSLPVWTLRNGILTQVASQDLTAGDVVKVLIGEEIRADLLILSSSSQEGQAFIDTCNLDGETNLKSRKAIEPTTFLRTVAAFNETKLVLHTRPPDPGLLSWTGMINLNGEEHAVSLDQFLYCGCVLRNTDFVWAMIAYAGVDTKMFRNLKEKPPKFSNLDKKLNFLIIIIFLLQNIVLFTLCSLACWWNSNSHSHWYLRWYIDRYGSVTLWGYRYLTYFILLSYFIPISLFVTIELCKVIQARWMQRDCQMMEVMGGRWRHCQPNTSNLNEQLALVKFIFSDKTGTLTENVMKYRKGDILGCSVDAMDWSISKSLLEEGHPMKYAAEEYFLALALCNTIHPFKDESEPYGVIYEGSSPDEVALVETAAEHGYRLVERSVRGMTILITTGGRPVEKRFDILATLEFTPNRKMMSIIVRDPDFNTITLYNKGADSFIRPQLSKEDTVQSNLRNSERILTEMSSIGLRTLVVCAKDLTEAEFESWNQKFIESNKALRDRSDIVDRVCLEMENNMRMVGLTAIEDCLQDQVPETISFFIDAGVVVWMLTGDKRETALSIAATSSLCDPRRDYIDHIEIGHMETDDPKAIQKVEKDLREIEKHVEAKKTNGKHCTLVVDGPALSIAMEHYFDLFLKVSQEVNSAVCCRLTPLQKANVVRMFQKSTGMTALAIGDGANDVPMIQEGRVGVGIIGLEGAQAALEADYAIPRFKHLRRLCAVHGRYNLARNAGCILVSFYKNISVSLLQAIFAFFTGFSGLTLVDGWLLAAFNVVLTSILPFFIGIFDKDLPEKTLMEKPALFSLLAQGEYFNYFLIGRWILESIQHSFALFFVIYPTMRKLDNQSNNFSGPMTGTCIYSGLVTVVLARLALQIGYWQWLQVLGLVSSIILFMALMLLYSVVPSFFGDTSFYWQTYVLLSGSKFWFYEIFFLGTLVIVLSFTIVHLIHRLFPSPQEIARREFMTAGEEDNDDELVMAVTINDNLNSHYHNNALRRAGSRISMLEMDHHSNDYGR